LPFTVMLTEMPIDASSRGNAGTGGCSCGVVLGLTQSNPNTRRNLDAVRQRSGRPAGDLE
jgi:hypothetical protein